MTLNGLLYSATLKQDPEIALSALNAGAIAAGLSGTGPAVVSLSCTKNDTDNIRDTWQQFDGEIIETGINNRGSRVII